MLQFEPVVSNENKKAIIDENLERVGTIQREDGKWFLTHIYCGGFGVDSMEIIRRKLKELNNA